MPFLILQTIISRRKGVRKGDHTDHLDTHPTRTLTMIDCLKYSFNKVSFLILHSLISLLMSLPLIQSNRSIHINPPMTTVKKKPFRKTIHQSHQPSKKPKTHTSLKATPSNASTPSMPPELEAHPPIIPRTPIIANQVHSHVY